MSLVIAKKIENDIFLISDTKLSDQYDEKLSTSLENHILKILVINSQLVFGFAGAVEDAEQTLKKISGNQTIDDIKSILYFDHCQSIRNNNYSVEFILALGEPYFELIEFKNGRHEQVQTSWLGSLAGFEHFQGFMLNKKAETASNTPLSDNTNANFSGVKLSMDFYPLLLPLNEVKTNQTYSDIYSKAVSAMNDVIQSGSVKEVGGFYLPVAYRNREFTYMHYSAVFSAEQIIPLTNSCSSTTISFGTPEAGSYVVSLIPEKDDKGAHYATFHFFHGQLGLIYEREQKGLPRPVLLRDHDSIDFSFALKKRFDLKEPPIVSIGFSLDNFGINGEKYIKVGNNEIALERLTWGIKKCQHDTNLWKLYRSRVILHFKMRKYLSALNDLNEIIIIAPQKEFEWIYTYRANAFAHLKKYHQAISNYDEVIKINSRNTTAYFNRSLCYYHTTLKTRSKETLAASKLDMLDAERVGYDRQQIINLKTLVDQLEQTL